MTDFDDTDIDNTEDEENKKKKKGGKTEGEGEGVGQTEVTVSQGFYAHMTSIGAPASLVAEVLKNWRHLRGEGLRRALADFARKVSSRATAHVEVDIGKDKNFSLIQNIINYFKNDAQQPEQKQRIEHRSSFDPK